MDNDIPYRTPFQTFSPAESVSSTDENEFSTLVKVTQDFADELQKLHDFDAFKIAKDKLPADRAKLLLYEVEVNKKVFDILMPLFEMLNGTVNDINAKYRERLNNGR
jgi:hypothetical protein